jgi:uncharacterized protein YhfF
MLREVRPGYEELLRQLERLGFQIPAGTLKVVSLGDSPELSERLLRLIRRGQKTATASLVWEWQAEGQTLPVAGDLAIVLDWNQEATMVIEYVDVQVKPFCEVTSDFAGEEGEGDRTLDSWRQGHWAFFTRACAELDRIPSENMPVVCARFRIAFDARATP